MSDPVCAQCGNEFEYTSRGRKPKMCYECRGVEKPPNAPSSVDVVDNLEMMLKARGQHISQDTRWKNT
jgi:peptide subunit release factor 1 (eRF1)